MGFSVSSSGGEFAEINDIKELKVPFPDGTNYVKTSDYGYRIDPVTGEQNIFHSGIDLAPPIGTEIVASAEGIVLEVGYSEYGLGNYVYIEHSINDETYITAYGHMLEGSIMVSEGQHVEAKQKIGIVGSTGKSTGIHLHFMVMKGKVCFVPDCLLDPIFVLENENKEEI